MKRDVINLEKFGRLSVILEDWSSWCARYSGIRSSSGSICMSSGYASSKSFDDLLDEVESQVAKLVDAAIDDLAPGQRAAINVRYGAVSVFRFPRGNYEDLLLDAHEALMVSLPQKGVVI